jgi:hypothetical protein
MLACADTDADLYFADLLPAEGTFTAKLIADANRDDSNAGLKWLVDRAPQLTAQTRLVLSGSPAFVYAATDTLVSAGLSEAQLESDVYSWAPR